MILDGQIATAIDQAVDALARGECIGLPTETVYGLAADAGNDTAVQGIFSAKGRPAEHPLIVHVADAGHAAHFAADIPAFAQKLIDAFWPGPLTLILPRRAGIASAAAGGHPTIGLRCPAHPVAHHLLALCAARGMPGLAAPSANHFGRISPTTAAHVAAEFGHDLLVLDGGPCAVGIESTIIDCTRSAPVLLRPGQIARERIEQAIGTCLLERQALASADPQAPGTLAAHYAPRARLRLMDAPMMRTALNLLGSDARHLAVWARTPLASASKTLLLRRMPADADAAAHEMFATLRSFDEAHVHLIWVETPPDDPAWDGVRDRLARAAASG